MHTTPSPSSGPLDVVVIGGGIAGLSATWRLRDRRVLLLEANDRLGGRLRSDQRGEYWLNYGAHLFPGPGTLVQGMVNELGLETAPVTGGMMGLAIGDKRLTDGRVETYPLRLPLSPRERIEFARAGLRVRRAVVRYLRIARPGPNESPTAVRARVLAYLDDTTFADFLGELSPAVRTVFSCAAHRATAELHELSAGCGVGLFALVWGGKGSLIACNLLGGTGELPAAFSRALGQRALVSARVTAITPKRTEQVIEYRLKGDVRRVLARHVIVAVPAPEAAPLVRGVAPAAADALEQLTYGAFLSLAVETNERRRSPWDDVYAMATPGRSFDMFTNQAQ
ncbi:MAG: FAD-dependent oxidoreductase, partial [Actinomycetota bacterium]|nr:FAD-dependent oxidoreductase [Actinomycetota bacterium]